MQHVDEFVDFPPSDDAGRYAAFFFLLHRLPAIMQAAFAKWIEPYKLYCTYEGKRYRVTGASRMGDVWLTSDFSRDFGYELRVDLAKCSDLSSTPNPGLQGTGHLVDRPLQGVVGQSELTKQGQ